MRKDNIPLAVCVVVFTVFALSLGDALVKLRSAEFVLWQIFVLRSIIAVPCIVLFAAVITRSSLHMPKAALWTGVRSILLVTMWVAYYISLTHLSLSVAAASYYTLPIFITLFSAALLGDKIGRSGWVAVALGFVGVLLILKPNINDFNWYALLPLLAAMFYALAMILTHTKCQAEHPLVLSLALNLCFIVVGLIASAFIYSNPTTEHAGFLTSPWRAMGSAEWATMGLLAIAILIGSIGAAIAYQNGPPSVIGIFDFAYVGFAVLWSIIFFADVPDAFSVIGIVVIVIAGVLSLRGS